MKPGLALHVGALALAAACAAAPNVKVEFDPAASFGSYHTFAFAEPLGIERGGGEGEVSRALKDSATRALAAKGLRLDPGAPGLLVDFQGRVTEKLRTGTVAPPTVGYYSNRYGYYGAWPGYPARETVVPYAEGTLEIELVDAATKRLVWEAVVVGEVTPAARADLAPAIDRAVAAALAKYPPDAAAKR